MTSLAVRANGHWKSILSQAIGEEYFSGNHGPCPLCLKRTGDGGTDRFRFDNKNGQGTYFCNQCGAGTGITLLCYHQDLMLPEAWKLVAKLLPTSTVEEPNKKSDYTKAIKYLIDSSVPVAPGSDVELYLHGRGIMKIPSSIRQTQYIDYSDPEKPTYNAMLCRASKHGKLTGLHLTLLQHGEKALIPNPRRLLKISDGVLQGSAIHLYGNVWATINSTLMVQVEIEQDRSRVLFLAEGIETALSTARTVGISDNDPHGIIIICGDNDPGYGGQAAAYTLAHKLTAKFGAEFVKVRIPEKCGTDWNDILTGRSKKKDW
jgi:putative DNA primase/helicase